MSKLILSCAVTNKKTNVTTYPEFGLDDLSSADDLENITRVATKWGDIDPSNKDEMIKVATALGFDSTDVQEFKYEDTPVYLYIQRGNPTIDSTTLLSHIESLTKHASRV